MTKRYLDFSQVRILPRANTQIKSRKECDTSTILFNHRYDVPVVIPSMRSVVTPWLIHNVEKAGGLVIQPRGMYDNCSTNKAFNASLDTALETAALLPDLGILSIEIAHGGMGRMGEVIREVKSAFSRIYILAGTVCTLEQADYLGDAGADGILAGIGVGSACTTTPTTGVGLPMFATLYNELRDYPLPVISAGGLREKGDFCKAIAAGADMCMIGSLLRGCIDLKDSEHYWGMASEKEKGNSHFVEGTTLTTVPLTKTSKAVIVELKEALQSAMSYVGASNLAEFRGFANFVEVG